MFRSYPLFLALFVVLQCSVPAMAQKRGRLPSAPKYGSEPPRQSNDAPRIVPNANRGVGLQGTTTEAIFAMEVDVKRLIFSDPVIASKLDFSNLIPNAEPGTPTTYNIRKMSLAISAPRNLDDLNGGWNGKKQPPLSFLCKVQFDDAAKAQKLIEIAMRSQDWSRETVGGKVVLRSREGGGSRNIVMSLDAESRFRVGTADYVEAGDANLFSANLSRLFNDLPDQPVRMAYDAQGVRHLIEEAKAKKADDPTEMMFLTVLENIASVRLAMDLDADNFASFVLSGTNAQAAATMQAQIDGFYAMMKPNVKKQVDSLPSKARPVLNALLDAVKTRRDGNDISVVLPKPEGFERAFAKLAKRYAPDTIRP